MVGEQGDQMSILKITQNIAQPIFSWTNTQLLPWTKCSAKICTVSVIFEKTAKSKQKYAKFRPTWSPCWWVTYADLILPLFLGSFFLGCFLIGRFFKTFLQKTHQKLRP
jgi:hypothetical protein